MSRIAEEITKLGCQTRDHTPYWQYSTIQYILQNEKYMGDSLAQKTYTTRSLPFQQRDNKGKLTQVLRKDVHPAIVSREEFSRVQDLLPDQIAVPQDTVIFIFRQSITVQRTHFPGTIV